MQRRTGEITFCFTDIEGSTALVRDLGAARYERVLDEHRAVLRHRFAERRGVEVHTEGDGMLFVWQDPHDAVQGCVAAQTALARHDWPYGVTVRVRMGVHTGPAVETSDGDYIGVAVHQAARIGAAGNGGQIVLSPTTAGVVEAEGAATGFSVVDLGTFHVRDFPGPVRLRLVHALGLPATVTPLRVPVAAPRNFGAVPTSFVGREQDLEALRAMVGQHRLVTIVGPGGVGKSRLAREVAQRVTGSFADGVWLVELATVGQPVAVAAAIATAVGITVPSGASPVDAVVDDLSSRCRLVVLDACENVLDAAASIVEEVAARDGSSSFLATTREALAVRSEQRWPLRALPVPEPSDDGREAVAALAAGRLFADRARAVQPSFVIDDSTAGAVAQICRSVEGIPLALELAAARIDDLGITELAASVQRVLELRGGYRTDAAHHRTMRALIAWSTDALSPVQRMAFRRLAPLRGWNSRRGAMAAAGSGRPPLDDDEAEAALAALVSKSIVLRGDDGRLRMLDPVREHATEELAASGEEGAVLEGLAAWALAERRAQLDPLQTPQRPTADPDLGFDTMRGLLAWSMEADPVMMGCLLTTMQRELLLGGRWIEGLDWTDTALLLVGDDQLALRAALLHVAGSICQTQGDGKRARDLAEQGLLAAEAALRAHPQDPARTTVPAIDVVTSLVGAANTLGASLLYERRLDEAEEMFERAASLSSRPSTTVAVLNNLASVSLARGDLAGAESSMRQAADLAAATDDPNAPQVRLNVAALRGISGDHAGAAAELEAGIEAAERLGLVHVLSMAETNLGIARRNLGDPRALDTLRQGIRRARSQGDLLALAEGMKALADISRDDPAQLKTTADDLAAVASRIPNDSTAAWATALIAVAAAAAGDVAEERSARRAAIALARAAALPPADAAMVLLELANSLVVAAPDRAARLLGAAHAANPPGVPGQPSWMRVGADVHARLRTALGEQTDLLVDEGRSLDLIGALDLADR